MIDQVTRKTSLPARRLPARILEGLEKRALAADVPAAKLPEIIQGRAIQRELIQHINYLEGIGREVAGQ